ncbi:MAG: hypothetical protein FJW66_06915 [Actinobacteria bacterium]|nr:hypothetical protein [Actinomycetota bacterium]
MRVERRVLKSISEFSLFKYVLVAYLIFFILFVIIFAIVGLIGWAALATSGIAFQDVLNSLIPGFNIEDMLGALGLGLGGGILGIIIFIIIGLVASVFAAAFAALTTWIFNVVLRIVGGIELRFAPQENYRHVSGGPGKPQAEKPLQNYQDYNLEQ